MRFTPVLQTATIVLLGRLNPAIISPGWLRHVNAIGESQLAAADTRIIHPDVSDFAIGHLNFNITTQKFQVSSAHEPFIQILETTEIIFRNLIHTPISKVGVNLALHFELLSRAQQHALGRSLAPLGPWGKWGQKLETTAVGAAGGLRALIMEEPRPDGREIGYRRVEIQPSTQINPHTGVYMSINDHFEVTEAVAETGASIMLSTLSDNFEASLATSREIISSMMDFAAMLKS